jgi:hypothetical protein
MRSWASKRYSISGTGSDEVEGAAEEVDRCKLFTETCGGSEPTVDGHKCFNVNFG